MGPYNPTKRRHVASDEFENGQWFTDDSNTLYVLPVGGDQVHGPDDAVADQLLRLWRRNDELSAADVEPLGLAPILPFLRRFDPAIGYYAA